LMHVSIKLWPGIPSKRHNAFKLAGMSYNDSRVRIKSLTSNRHAYHNTIKTTTTTLVLPFHHKNPWSEVKSIMNNEPLVYIDHDSSIDTYLSSYARTVDGWASSLIKSLPCKKRPTHPTNHFNLNDRPQKVRQRTSIKYKSNCKL